MPMCWKCPIQNYCKIGMQKKETDTLLLEAKIIDKNILESRILDNDEELNPEDCPLLELLKQTELYIKSKGD